MNNLRLPLLLALSLPASGAFVYECSLGYDCVTPFQRTRAAAPASIPFWPGYNPALVEGANPFQNLITNAGGDIAGLVNYASAKIPFFSNGVTTSVAPGLDLTFFAGSRPVDLSDNGVVVVNLICCSSPVIAGTVLEPLNTFTAPILGVYPPTHTLQLLEALAISADGSKILGKGVRREFNSGTQLESDLLLIYSTTELQLVPEPSSVALMLVALVFLALRPYFFHRPFGGASSKIFLTWRRSPM